MSDDERPSSPIWLSFIVSQTFFAIVLAIVHFGFDAEVKEGLGFVEGVAHGVAGPISIWRTIFGAETDLKHYYAPYWYDVGFMLGFWSFLQLIDRAQGTMVKTMLGAEPPMLEQRRAVGALAVYLVLGAVFLPLATQTLPFETPVDDIPAYLGILGGWWRWVIQLGLFGLGSFIFTLVTLLFALVTAKDKFK